MKQESERAARMCGSVTVFVTLIFMLIMTMILTCLESSYQAACRSFASCAAGAATESLFADYFAPLFEEYHVFGVNKGTEEYDLAYEEYLAGMMNKAAWQVSVENADTEIYCTLADEGGRNFRKQAIAYEKVAGVENLLEDFLAKVGILTGQDDECKLIKKKMKAEKELAALDEDVMYLMKKIDGISFEDGKMKKEPFYVKSTSPSVARTHIGELERLGEKCFALSKEENEETEETENAEETKRSLENAKGEYKTAYNRFKQLVNCTLNTTISADMRIDEIKLKQPSLQETVTLFMNEYDSYTSGKDSIGNGVLGELGDSLETMKGYVGITSTTLAGLDFDVMKDTVSKDRKILEKVKSRLSSIASPPLSDEESGEAGLLAFKASISDLEVVLADYSLYGLEFDYSSYRTDTIKDNVTGALEGAAAEGILRLIYDADDLSENELGDEVSLFEESPDEMLEDVDSDVEVHFGDSVMDSFLYVNYTTNHFYNLKSKELEACGGERLEGHVLNYEQEFILCGGETDRINLERMAGRLLMMRLPGSLIYCLTNSKVRTEAEEFATAVVGFTGLPFVVSFLKYLVILVWATVQALIETSAILNGKKIPIVTDKALFCTSLTDIPKLSRAMIKEKVHYIKEVSGMPDYEDYLLFMLIIEDEEQKTARMQDLIERNIRDKYLESFSLKNCICEAKTVTDFRIRPLYIGGRILEAPRCTVIKEYRY